MKKIWLLCFMAGMATQGMSQQISVYIAGGYGIGDRTILGYETINTPDMNMESPLYGSLGNSINVSAGACFGLCEKGGVGAEIDYVSGMKQQIGYTNSESFGSTWMIEEYDQSMGVQVFPYVYVQLPLNDAWSVSSRIGPVANVLGTNTYTQDYTQSTGSSTFTQFWQEETKQKFSLGLRAGLSLSYQLSDNISIGGELYAQNLTAKTSSTEVTEYTDDGEDMLDQLSTYDREINYVEKLDENSNNVSFNSNYDMELPRDVVVESHNYSRSGFQVGLALSF